MTAPIIPTAETLKRHGISEQEFRLLWDYQGGKCAVCGGDPGPRGFHIDHDHRLARKAGRRASVRGLVHPMCNRHLGQIRDSVKIAEGMARYLLDPPARHVIASGSDEGGNP